MAYKMLKYIQRTSGYFRKITSDGTSLTMYPDAAFAPSSSRSQTGWVIYYGGTPVLWRSSRQSTTALSTAEAESNAILEGSIAMLGIEAMLLDVSEEIHEQLIGSDSMSALSLTAGTGSWRTRHLRIKASWLQEALSVGSLQTKHVPGVVQPADLLTKALPSQRRCDLLKLWGVEDGRKSTRATKRAAFFTSLAGARAVTAGRRADAESRKMKDGVSYVKGGSIQALVALVCRLLVVSTEASTVEVKQKLELDWDMVSVMAVLLLGGLVC